MLKRIQRFHLILAFPLPLGSWSSRCSPRNIQASVHITSEYRYSSSAALLPPNPAKVGEPATAHPPRVLLPSLTMSHTPVDPYFIQSPDLDLLAHRPQKSAVLLFNAITATALFRNWPTLLFFGAWSAGICSINVYTTAKLSIPSTMLPALGTSFLPPRGLMQRLRR